MTHISETEIIEAKKAKAWDKVYNMVCKMEGPSAQAHKKMMDDIINPKSGLKKLRYWLIQNYYFEKPCFSKETLFNKIDELIKKEEDDETNVQGGQDRGK